MYLPQFHPIPENDTWWGKGFTEWRNVVKATPRFEGHYQPHLPADLGYYDLRVPETRVAQADLAKEYGIYGFCYYHYWFNGKRILERPFQEVFDSGKPDFPFMLCWANENWTRVWDGGDDEILLKQNYSKEDDIAHINFLIPFFRDPRYIKVNGRPIFIIYKDALIPDIESTVTTFRDECAKSGIDLYLCKFDRQRHTLDLDETSDVFDAVIEFQPLSSTLVDYRESKSFLGQAVPKKLPKFLDYKRYLDFAKKKLKRFVREKKCIDPGLNNIISYSEFIDFDLARTLSRDNIKVFPGVSPGFDNSPRRQGKSALIFEGSTPTLFKKWVSGKLSHFKPYGKEENFIFVNAWNEWAEGNHLEPCEKWGHGYLQALKDALEEE